MMWQGPLDVVRGVRELEQRERWVPVGDRLPDIGVVVMVAVSGAVVIAERSADGWYQLGVATMHWLEQAPTHWRPMPAPPSVEGVGR